MPIPISMWRVLYDRLSLQWLYRPYTEPTTTCWMLQLTCTLLKVACHKNLSKMSSWIYSKLANLETGQFEFTVHRKSHTSNIVVLHLTFTRNLRESLHLTSIYKARSVQLKVWEAYNRNV